MTAAPTAAPAIPGKPRSNAAATPGSTPWARASPMKASPRSTTNVPTIAQPTETRIPAARAGSMNSFWMNGSTRGPRDSSLSEFHDSKSLLQVGSNQVGDIGHEREVRAVRWQRMGGQFHHLCSGVLADRLGNRGGCAQLGEDRLGPSTPDLGFERRQVRRRSFCLGRQAGNDGADKLEAVAGGEVAERLVAGDELALALRNDGERRRELLIKLGEATLQVSCARGDIDPKIGLQLGRQRRNHVLHRQRIHPEVRVGRALGLIRIGRTDSLALANVSDRDVIRRDEAPDAGLLSLVEGLAHATFEVQPVLDEQIRLGQLLNVLCRRRPLVGIRAVGHEDGHIGGIADEIPYDGTQDRVRHDHALLARIGTAPGRAGATDQDQPGHSDGHDSATKSDLRSLTTEPRIVYVTTTLFLPELELLPDEQAPPTRTSPVIATATIARPSPI